MQTRINRSLMIVGTLFAALLAPASFAQSSYVGKTFPDFEFTDALSREKHKLSDFRGRVVLIDFWATWCGPCIGELPNVKRAFRRHHDDGFDIISISLDSDVNKGKSFVRRSDMEWYHAIEGGGWSTRLAKQFNIRSIPAMFVIDHEGKCISDSARGPRLQQIVSAAVGKLEGAGGPAEEVATPRDPGPNPERVAAMRKTVREARTALRDAASPIADFSERLDVLSIAVDALQRQVTGGTAVAALASRSKQIDLDLRALRQEMFICSFLDDQLVALPTDPFAEAGAAPTAGTVLDHIAKLRESLVGLRQALAAATSPLDAAESELDESDRAMSSPTIDFEAIQQRCDDAHNLAAELEQRYTDPWRTRLGACQALVESFTTPLAQSIEALDAMQQRVDDCRGQLISAGRDPGAQQKLKEDFASLCKSIAEHAARHPGVKAPSNPFESGSARDLRARVEAEGQLRIAEQAIESMRSELGTAKQTLDGYCQQMLDLHEEFADSEGGDAQIEKRFNELCEQMLALRDRVGA